MAYYHWSHRRTTFRRTAKSYRAYAFSNIDDLSLYGVGFANNGKGSPGVEFKFPQNGAPVASGTYITISSEETQLASFFGRSPNYITGYVSINGNDAIELYMHDRVVDVYGDVNVDGSGTVWDYKDGWAYRRDASVASTVFDSEDWILSGSGVLDSCLSNSDCDAAFPEREYVSATAVLTSPPTSSNSIEAVVLTSPPTSSTSVGVRYTFSGLIRLLLVFTICVANT